MSLLSGLSGSSGSPAVRWHGVKNSSSPGANIGGPASVTFAVTVSLLPVQELELLPAK